MDLAARINVLRWAFKEVDALEFWNKCADAVEAVVESLKRDLEGEYALEDFQKQVCVLPQGLNSRPAWREEPEGPVTFASFRPGDDPQESTFRETDQLNSPDSFVGTSPPTSWYAPATAACSPFPSETDSDVSYSSSPPDSGHETLGELSSPEELYRQFNYYQGQHCNPEPQSPAPCFAQWPMEHNAVAPSFLPLSEVAVDGISTSQSPLQLPFHGETDSGPLVFSGILNGPDILTSGFEFGCETFGSKDTMSEYNPPLDINPSTFAYL